MRYRPSSIVPKIDRLGLAAYLGLVSGCGGGAGFTLVMPNGGTPASPEQAQVWIQEGRPQAPALHRFRWQYRDRNEAGGGRGSARIAAGDSLRLDLIGPLGAGRGAAFIVGDEQQWAEPEEEVRKLAPSYPLLWAMLGIPRAPAAFHQVTRFENESLVAWRFVRAADTVDIARISGSPHRLVVDVREGGGRVGRVETIFNPDGALRTSRLDVPSVQARLQINYYETSHPAAFPPEIWLPPERQP